MFKNLKVAHKIVLIVVAVALPLIAATLFATIKGFNKDINFAVRCVHTCLFSFQMQAGEWFEFQHKFNRCLT